MSIGLLGGFAKGFSLSVPKGDLVRPTSVMLKRRLFDSHQNWDDEVFIDLCSGSGSMAFEAWSRGAFLVEFIEKNAKAISAIKQNLNKLQSSYKSQADAGEMRVSQLDAISYFKNLKLRMDSGDYAGRDLTVFFDPPYEEHKLYLQMVELLCATPRFVGKVIIESDTDKGPEKDIFKPLSDFFVKELRQGASYLLIYNFTP